MWGEAPGRWAWVHLRDYARVLSSHSGGRRRAIWARDNPKTANLFIKGVLTLLLCHKFSTLVFPRSPSSHERPHDLALDGISLRTVLAFQRYPMRWGSARGHTPQRCARATTLLTSTWIADLTSTHARACVHAHTPAHALAAQRKSMHRARGDAYDVDVND